MVAWDHGDHGTMGPLSQAGHIATRLGQCIGSKNKDQQYSGNGGAMTEVLPLPLIADRLSSLAAWQLSLLGFPFRYVLAQVRWQQAMHDDWRRIGVNDHITPVDATHVLLSISLTQPQRSNQGS